MKNLNKPIVGLAALLIGATAFAQGSTTNSPTNSVTKAKATTSKTRVASASTNTNTGTAANGLTPVSTVGQPSTAVSTKAPAPAKDDEGGWSFAWGTVFAIKNDPKNNGYQSQPIITYGFTPIISLSATTVITGPLNDEPGKQHIVSDPEVELDFAIPLLDKESKNKFNLDLATSVVMPTSEESWNNSMLIGGSLGAGFTFIGNGWTVIDNNYFYAFSYRQALPETPTVTSVPLEGLFDDTPAKAKDGPAYVQTIHRLQIVRKIVSTLSAKGDFWYTTSTPTENNTTRSALITFSLGYGITKNFKISAGVSTSKVLTQDTAPDFYTEKSTYGVIGVGIKL